MLQRLLMALLACSLIANTAVAEEDPQQVVIATADKVLEEVTKRKAELEADSSLIYPLVEVTVLPRFDFEAMTRSAMGRFWRNASSDQQQRIVVEFRELLVRTYATALLGYSGQQIEYPPMHVADGASKVMVPTKIRTEGGPPIPINYRLRADDDGKWLVYDVVIDGISLVTNYRSTFARQIQQGAAAEKNPAKRMAAGIESLIEVLAAKNDKSA